MTESLLKTIVADYALPWDGTHGIRHWGRVFENGSKLAEQTGADLQVVELFALFHDCRRVNEGRDPGHGQRGGDLAQALYLTGALKLSEERLAQLIYACKHHTKGWLAADPTIETCWDADRLDLGRVWITPQPKYLCTTAAKDSSMIEWAEERSRSDHQPPVVDQWLSWLDPDSDSTTRE